MGEDHLQTKYLSKMQKKKTLSEIQGKHLGNYIRQPRPEPLHVKAPEEIDEYEDIEIDMPDWLRNVLIVVALILFLNMIHF